MRRLWPRRSVLVDVPSQRPAADGTPAGNRDYSINCTLGGFGMIGIPWSGTSWEEARDSFLEYLYNHDEFADLTEPHLRSFRSLYVRFNGQARLLTFRTDWITGFSVH